jgi:hypothetical protein
MKLHWNFLKALSDTDSTVKARYNTTMTWMCVISLWKEAYAFKTNLIRHFLLKCLYQVKKVAGDICVFEVSIWHLSMIFVSNIRVFMRYGPTWQVTYALPDFENQSISCHVSKKTEKLIQKVCIFFTLFLYLQKKRKTYVHLSP